jgi:type I restriction enzyme R subunit
LKIIKANTFDLYDKSKKDEHQVEKVSILRCWFELELIHRDEVNVTYPEISIKKIPKRADKERKQKEIIDLLTGE